MKLHCVFNLTRESTCNPRPVVGSLDRVDDWMVVALVLAGLLWASTFATVAQAQIAGGARTPSSDPYWHPDPHSNSAPAKLTGHARQQPQIEFNNSPPAGQGRILVDPNEIIESLNQSRSGSETPFMQQRFIDGGSGRPVQDGRSSQSPIPFQPFSLNSVSDEEMRATESIEPRESDQDSSESQREDMGAAIDSRPRQESDSSAAVDSARAIPERETIVENFPNGKPRVRREVAMDEDGNYYNHGKWEVFDQQGNTVAQGQYRHGLMHGLWGRRHVSSEGGLFATQPFNLYTGPYDSYAYFENGKLHGQWEIYDNTRRKIFEIGYRNGKRHGEAVWYYPDAQEMRTATFRDGMLDGEVKEWDQSPEHKLVSVDRYLNGRKIVRTTVNFRPDQPQSVTTYLDQRLEPEGIDNWWEAKPSPFLPSGQRIQEGPVGSWYSNGQMQFKGQYKDDHPIGQFFWWHENGNRKTVGFYNQSGQREGEWTWWHPNGMKSFEGSYEDGEPVGRWRSWFDDGQLRKSKNYDGPELGPPQTVTEEIKAPGQTGNLPVKGGGESDGEDDEATGADLKIEPADPVESSSDENSGDDATGSAVEDIEVPAEVVSQASQG